MPAYALIRNPIHLFFSSILETLKRYSCITPMETDFREDASDTQDSVHQQEEQSGSLLRLLKPVVVLLVVALSVVVLQNAAY